MTITEAKKLCKAFNNRRPPDCNVVACVFVDTQTFMADDYIAYITDAETGAIIRPVPQLPAA